MKLPPQVSELLDKKMDRSAFLKQVGIGLVAMTGATTVMRTLAPQEQKVTIFSGYGMGAYGGVKEEKLG